MRNQFIRVATTTAFAAAALVGAAQPASAAEPTFEAGVACDFAVNLTVTGGNLQLEPRNVVGANNGQPARIVTAAGSTGTVTISNFETGESISFRSKGVGSTFDPKTGTATYGGQLLLILFDTDVPAGPSTTLYTGRVVYTVDANGVFTLQSTAGQAIDVCAALEP